MFFRKNVLKLNIDIPCSYYLFFGKNSCGYSKKNEVRKLPTIFSLCSGRGKCGVSVFRISGSNAFAVLNTMTKTKLSSKVLNNKLLDFAKIYHAKTKTEIDHGIILWFPGPNSLTGEDVCELQTHGGPAIVKQILSSLSSLNDFRPALPGEFIRRSFENGKVDLTQVEGLLDLINAETDDQHRLALNMYKGATKETYHKWMNIIVKNLAHIEALIDFGEEENLNDWIFHNVIEDVTKLQIEILQYLNKSQIYERMRDGLKICIIGRPNVGKSSLLNALCRRQAALVSPQEGTTRDVIEVALNFEGHSLLISDTAGMREDADDLVEKLGIERAIDSFQEADVIVLVMDATNENIKHLIGLTSNIDGCVDLENENKMNYLYRIIGEFIVKSLTEINLKESALRDKSLILVLNKSDLMNDEDLSRIKMLLTVFDESLKIRKDECKNNDRSTLIENEVQPSNTNFFSSSLFHSSSSPPPSKLLISESTSLSRITSCCLVSCYHENGLNKFEEILKKVVHRSFEVGPNVNIVSMNARHKHYLNVVCSHLKDFIAIMTQKQADEYDTRLELSAEKLRFALQNMGQITGKVTTDQILDKIFSDFCIGK